MASNAIHLSDSVDEAPLTENALYAYIAKSDYEFLYRINIVNILNDGIRDAAIAGYNSFDFTFISDDYEGGERYTPEAIERILDRIVYWYEDSNLSPDWAFYQDNYHITFSW